MERKESHYELVQSQGHGSPLPDSQDKASVGTVRPSMFSVLLVLFGVVVFYFFANITSVLIAQLIIVGTSVGDQQELVPKLLGSRLGFVLILVPGQLAILLPPLVAALLSFFSSRRSLNFC